MLLLAGGLGFAAGNLTKRQAATPSKTKGPRASYKTLFARALKLIAFARMLSRTFPSADMGPSAQSGLPGQAPTPRYRSAAA
jgi:hypothetical protein